MTNSSKSIILNLLSNHMINILKVLTLAFINSETQNLGYVFDIFGSGKTRLTFPKDDRQELSLTQHFLVFQIFIPTEAPFCLEVMITDTLKVFYFNLKIQLKQSF